MKTELAVLVLLAAFTSHASAADNGIEQKKADQLKRIDERIVHLQEERACIQAAANHDALRACHEKFRNEIKADKAKRRQ